MPQTLSRMDDTNWLTPSIADILEQGAAPPGGDGSIRQYMLQIQDELNELGTPARIINVRSTPSYTLYIARPDVVGRLGNRRVVTPNEVRRSLGRIAEQHKEWTLGFMPQLQEDEEAIGILLRTDQHQPLSLRRLVVRNTFRDYPSRFAVIQGVTLEQQLIVRDLSAIGHLLVVGSENSKQHFVRATALTLTLLNTPGELRLALVGQGSEAYKVLSELPHALGRILLTPTDGQRLFDGLVKEIQRRQQKFAEENVDTIADYNAKQSDPASLKIPQILLVVDTVSDANWQAAREQWASSLVQIVKDGIQVGIYALITTAKVIDLPEELQALLTNRVITRSSASNILGDRLKNFHGSLLRFVDAFVVEDDEGEPIPVELCAVTDVEVQRTVEYWKQAAIQRKQENQMAAVSGKTGVTGILRPAEPIERPAELPTPPVPEKPSSDTLVRATQILAHSEHHEELEQAQALAAYLGWLGVGPLHDILGFSLGEAHAVLNKLQMMGVIENSDSPTPRFLRYVSRKDEG